MSVCARNVFLHITLASAASSASSASSSTGSSNASIVIRGRDAGHVVLTRSLLCFYLASMRARVVYVCVCVTFPPSAGARTNTHTKPNSHFILLIYFSGLPAEFLIGFHELAFFYSPAHLSWSNRHVLTVNWVCCAMEVYKPSPLARVLAPSQMWAN